MSETECVITGSKKNMNLKYWAKVNETQIN